MITEYPQDRTEFWETMASQFGTMRNTLARYARNRTRLSRLIMPKERKSNEVLYSVWLEAGCRVLARRFVASGGVSTAKLTQLRMEWGVQQNHERYDTEILPKLDAYQNYTPDSPITVDELLNAFDFEWRTGLQDEVEDSLRPLVSIDCNIDISIYDGNCWSYTRGEAIAGAESEGGAEGESFFTGLDHQPFVLKAAATLFEEFGQSGLVFLASEMTDRPMTKVLNQMGISVEELGPQEYEMHRKRFDREIRKNKPQMLSRLREVVLPMLD